MSGVEDRCGVTLDDLWRVAYFHGDVTLVVTAPESTEVVVVNGRWYGKNHPELKEMARGPR
jgi:hypothetical protein